MITITEDKSYTNYETVSLNDDQNELVILDQTQLPNKAEYIRLKTKDEFWDAIYKLKVRGAPAIGVAAGYSLYLCAKLHDAADYDDFYNNFINCKNYLATSRPTAVNLFWALDKMEARLNSCNSRDIKIVLDQLLHEANKIKQEDIQTCKAIGEFGLSLLKPGMGLLTHCNAGSLATSRYGTALAPIYLGHEKGYSFKVFADETRPLLQGARLTAYELNAAGVDTTLICDNMASVVMKNGWIDAVFVGCDRVAANGDTANKIGTSGVAILAKNYGIPFYVCAPTSTIDINCKSGNDITIELRNPEEITDMWFLQPMAPKGIKVYNPAFDVTESSFITAIITENGIAYPPFGESISRLLKSTVI